MKLKCGSLQQKRGLWYLVTYVDGKKKWTALHTREQSEAVIRAMQRFPAEAVASDEEAYLLAQVEQGDLARRKLEAMRTQRVNEGIQWEGIFDKWQECAPRLTQHDPTLDVYALLIGEMCRWFWKRGVLSPTGITPTLARSYVKERLKTTPSFGRNVALFRRVWRDLDMPQVWDMHIPAPKTVRYRRLTVEEVRKLVLTLRTGRVGGKSRVKGKFTAGDIKPLPDVADLVLLAYHTGLRRKDVAGLRVENVDGDLVRVVPAKTEGRKRMELVIPLQPEPLAVVERLVHVAEDGYLFPRLYDASLGKCLRLAFERAGVKSNTLGHASFHSLRATFISAMDDAGVPQAVTDAITGHAPVDMHGRYSQPGRDVLMRAVVGAVKALFV